MERYHLIAGLVGWFCAKEPSIIAEDLRIKIDQVLADSKFIPLGSEEGDLLLLDEMCSEFLMSVLGRGFYRKDRRNI